MNYKLIPLFLLMCIFALPAQAKMYKWIDEEGNVHFGDKIPDKELSREHKVINDQGATVKTIPAAATDEEKREQLRLELLKKEEQKKADEKAKRDRVLLDTYTTERDLTAARDARLDAVDSQLQLSESIIEDARRKLDLTEKQITNIKASGREVPKNISDKMQLEEKQLETYKEVAAGHQQRKKQITEQFDGYIKRFRELKADSQRIKDEREARRREALGM